MRHDPTPNTLQCVAAATAVLGLAIAGVPLSVLILHGQSIDTAVLVALRAVWAYLIVLAALAAAAAAVLLATALLASALQSLRRPGR